ncbi:MAG TPA: hypoxanthine-guanine phosphoribosyltransferase [Gammaproteobacteria bacterium]|nr:hypoxanthine-guanine phosphoribosyltransferase [Gammaproteobacteria bacterium]
MDHATLSSVFGRSTQLYSETEVEMTLDKMALAISEKLSEKDPILLCVMNGGLITTGKLATRLNFPLQLDYLHASRYRGETSGSKLHWEKRPSLDLKGRVVLVIDDIFDEGATLDAIVSYCSNEGAAEIFTAVLTDKQHDRKLTTLRADFVGLRIPDKYVFGYGLDYKGYLRNAAGIYAIDGVDY